MNKMGRAYSMYEGKARCIEDFGGENLEKETIWKAQA
jgi:hypothetical protein